VPLSFADHDNSNRDQDAARGLKQTRRGSNNRLPHLAEKIDLRGHPACDTTTDADNIHGLFSLVHLIDYYLGIIPAIASANGHIRERSGP
jgi:hypothetical protein